jgi:tRNA modification GTPase
MNNSTSAYTNDTICAVATPPGEGAIAVIRLSGSKSADILNKVFKKKGKFNGFESHKIYLGTISDDEGTVDEVLVSFFKAPHSYTGEDIMEVSCHGSQYIQQRIIELFLSKGARLANPGEFTLRAFLNGKMDLSQAEAVADLIASHSKSAHSMAIKQMRGGFSHKIKELRHQLLNLASLMELELDFSEEDVEFADRNQFHNITDELIDELSKLKNSFKLGNVLKKGIPVAIIGKPNSGKSTLLNAILNEEKAIVSDIPGTTRDSIEDTIIIQGHTFRFIDTAGLRQSDDVVENLGIERTYDKIKQASIVLYVCDISDVNKESMENVLDEFKSYIKDDNKSFILVANKIDKLQEVPSHLKEILNLQTVFVSAKRRENIHLLAETLVNVLKEKGDIDDIIVNNSRHYEAISKALDALQQVKTGFVNNIPTDLIAIDLRQALYYLGSITGEVTTDEILGNIFGKFCIGK